MAKIKGMVLALIMTSMIFIGFSTFFIDMVNHPRDNTIPTVTNTNSNNFTSFRQLNSTVSELSQANNNLLSGVRNIPIAGEIAATTLQGVSVLTFIGTLPTTLSNMIVDVGLIFGVPAWASLGIQGIVVAIIVLTLAAAFLNRDEI